MVTTLTETLSTRGHNDCLDITDRVQRAVRTAKLAQGLATVFVPGSTAGVTTVEYEPGVVEDLQAAISRLIPTSTRYHHHETAGDDNGFSHVRAALIGASLSIPVVEGKLALGTWQQIVLIDFDTHPRQRSIVIQLLGNH